MKLSVIHFSKKSIQHLSETERMLFCQVTILQTELDIMRRMAIMSANGLDKAKEIEGDAQFVQMMFIINMMSGKINEGWDTIKLCIHSKQLGQEYAKALSPAAKQSLNQLNKYFAKDNIIHYIRKTFAFHYDRDALKAGLDLFDDNHQFSMYGNEKGGNALSRFGYEVILRKVLHYFNPEDERLGWKQGMPETVNKLYDEIMNIQRELQVICEDILRIISCKHEYAVEYVSIDSPEYLENLRFPYFVRTKREI